jgi:hypothetical protein
MTMPHTSGRWEASQYHWAVENEDGERVVQIEPGNPNYMADACLISAAPDLLEAAEFYVANCPQRSMHHNHDRMCDGPMCRTFRVAIAKAKGEKAS